jgi:hypothetical protein
MLLITTISVDAKVKIYEGTNLQQEGKCQKDWAVFNEFSMLDLRRNVFFIKNLQKCKLK